MLEGHEKAEQKIYQKQVVTANLRGDVTCPGQDTRCEPSTLAMRSDPPQGPPA